MPLAEYDSRVGPLNKQFHETAEMMLLYSEGVLPLDPDEREDVTDDVPSGGGSQKTIRRTPRG